MTALPTRRGAILGALLVSGALILSGCAAGQKAATANEVPVVDGVTANIGSINLRALTIATPSGNSYAAGSSAQVQLFIINNSSTPDQLLSVSTTSAKSVAIYANADAAASATSTPTLTTPAPSTPTDTSTDSGSGSPTNTASSTSSADTSSAPSTTEAPPTPVESSSAPTPAATITLPSGETVPVGIGSSDPVILITGLNAQLFPAMTIPITFNFAHAGSVTLQVSVHLSTGVVNAPTLATGHVETGS